MNGQHGKVCPANWGSPCYSETSLFSYRTYALVQFLHGVNGEGSGLLLEEEDPLQGVFTLWPG